MDEAIVGVYDVTDRDSLNIVSTGSLQECLDYVEAYVGDANLMIVSRETTEEISV
jgi:hypothetical protein